MFFSRAGLTVLCLVFLLVFVPHTCRIAGKKKILIFPYTNVYNSRTMNLEKIAVMLKDHDFHVTMLVSHHYAPKRNIDGVNLIRYKIPELQMNKGGEFDLDRSLRYIEKDVIPLLRQVDEMDFAVCEHLLSSNGILDKLRDEKFDLLFFDFVNVCSGPIIYESFGIPSIMYSNFGFMETWTLFKQPTFYSYTPGIYSSFSDNMTFWDRVQNTDMLLDLEKWASDRIDHIERMKAKYLPNNNWPHAKHSFERVSLIIAANVNFALDYPRPVMPHVIPISGLLWTPAKPLPKEYENIVSAAPNGVILVSFGTLVPTFSIEKAEILARVFSKLSQTVIWRYQGVPPKSVGNNTHLVEWLPQNDLLAHPNTKLFITHCGVSSTWETLYHAVPVVAIPLLWDQHHHARKLKERAKISETVNFGTLNEEELESTILKVVSDKSYKENAIKMSKLLQDTPMSGQEELLYWIKYVIRHNGTLHFHSHAAYGLNWYQYYLLDVISYKAAASCLYYLTWLLPLVIVWKVFRFVFIRLKCLIAFLHP
ncbi:UDP-glucuronosyltransferase 2B10 [Lingula anatina]|uniref:UDP-glucuronosyltransferase n=1 Tax=Lingula anatina TaxID=7574 RepID=A0A1S3J459_LINAN|nr:UDP-glucuronosyltransferase 2B10 [Lingula anatina]|eukprot:XP_013405056.2 UDP-glucuronosyltransferase 2B10 [Lingula anatina]